MTHIKKWIISLWAPTAAFGLVMLLHLFIWTPGQMYQDKLKESGLLTNQVATLTKANAGFESRFGQLREQLAEEQKITKHQAATISSLQAQLSQSASKLADIDAQRDKSAAAVLRRSTNLCSQLSAFLAERNRGEQSIDAGVVFSRGANGQMQASKGGKMISEAEAHELRDAAWKARGAFDYETDVKFVNQFAARLMALRDDFAGIGIVSESFNQTLGSSFRMDWGRREILMEINKMAAQVRD